MKNIIKKLNLYGRINGILLDLGLSTPQLMDGSRGFSFQKEGPLDMRMDINTTEPIWIWLNKALKKDIIKVLHEYGQEKFALKIANTILIARKKTPIKETTHLAKLIEKVVPRRGRIHPATKTFQALRIFTNNELNNLRNVLHQACEVLTLKGRIGIITFHSLEGQIVKDFFRTNKINQAATDELSMQFSIREILKIFPSRLEIKKNPKSRSGVLRIGEKIALQIDSI